MKLAPAGNTSIHAADKAIVNGENLNVQLDQSLCGLDLPEAEPALPTKVKNSCRHRKDSVVRTLSNGSLPYRKLGPSCDAAKRQIGRVDGKDIVMTDDIDHETMWTQRCDLQNRWRTRD